MAIQRSYAHTRATKTPERVSCSERHRKKRQGLHPQTTRAVSTGTDTPGLARMPVDIEDTQLASNLVALEDLERNDTGVAEHISRDATVENLQGTIVTGVSKQRVATTGVELHGTNSLAMVTKGLVRPLRQVQIVPEQATVVRADNDIVAARGSR